MFGMVAAVALLSVAQAAGFLMAIWLLKNSYEAPLPPPSDGPPPPESDYLPPWNPTPWGTAARKLQNR